MIIKIIIITTKFAKKKFASLRELRSWFPQPALHADDGFKIARPPLPQNVLLKLFAHFLLLKRGKRIKYNNKGAI